MITIDAVSSSSGAGVSSLTFAHTVAANAKILIVSTGHANATPARTVSGITYNGVALTAARQDANTPATVQWLNGIWYLLNPPAGTADIVITLSGSVQGIGGCGISAFSSDPVNIVNITGATSSLGSPLTLNITPTAPSLIVDSMNVERGVSSLAVAAGQTERVNVDTTAQIKFGCSTKVNTGAADTMGWTWTGSNPGAITAVAFQADRSFPGGMI